MSVQKNNIYDKIFHSDFNIFHNRLMRENFVYDFLSLLFFFMPVLVFYFFLFVTQTKVTQLVPLNVDEIAWFTQVKSVVTYGMPLGYKGYNETHAQIGTFGPWGAPIIYIMSILPKLFGWKLYSPMLINSIRWCIANIFFFIFTRPNKNALIKLTIIHLFLFSNIYFMFSAMSEMTRFCMAIFLAGMMYYLLYAEFKDRFVYKLVLYVIAPTILCWFSMAYALFSFFLFIYGYILYKRFYSVKNRVFHLLGFCVVLPIAISLICRCINHLTACPYPHFQMRPIAAYLHAKNPFDFIQLFIKRGYVNFCSGDLVYIIKNAKSFNGYVSSYMLFYYILFVFFSFNLYSVFKRSNDNKEKGMGIIISLLLGFFIFAFMFLHDEMSWNYVRGLSVSCNFVFYFMCLIPENNIIYRKARFNNNAKFLCVISISMICFLPCMMITGDLLQKQKSQTLRYKTYAKYEKVFTKQLTVTRDAETPWENTVAFYGKTYFLYCALPAGLSSNKMMSRKYKVSRSKYVSVQTGYNISIPTNYKEIYKDNRIILYERQ